MPLTAEQIEKSNKEFDKWFADEYWFLAALCRRKDFQALHARDCYRSVWLARQETLCVELPEEITAEETETPTDMHGAQAYGYSCALDDCRMSIEAAGIAHK